MAPRAESKEYGHRLYVSPMPYADHKRKPTDKALDDLYKLPHSENKKPYAEDSYEGMEYFLSPPFGMWPWNWPEWDWPNDAGGIPAPWFPPWLLVFTCQLESGACFCEGEENCYDLRCSHPVTGITVFTLGDPRGKGGWTSDEVHFSFTYSDNQVCVLASERSDGFVRFMVQMVADPGTGRLVYGEAGPFLLPQCLDEDEACDCPDGGPLLSWAGGNPTLIFQGDDISVSIAGGTPPFKWVTSEGNITWDAVQTTSRTNSFHVENAACGCIRINVIDACGRTLLSDAPATPTMKVQEDSAWSGYHDSEQTLFSPCPAQDWATSTTNVACDSPCYQNDNLRGGPFYAGSCPQSCSCDDPVIDHSFLTSGCRFTCLHQAGARAVRTCDIQIRDWRCT